MLLLNDLGKAAAELPHSTSRRFSWPTFRSGSGLI